MTFWQWIVTPAGIPLLVALVGLVSGVVGGGVSQLIAGAFKTRGDTRALNAANENAKAAERRWEREQAFERRKLYVAALREACTRYLANATGTRWLYTQHELGIDGLDGSEYVALRREYFDLRASTRQELLLLAPQLREPLDQNDIVIMELGSGIRSQGQSSYLDIVGRFDAQMGELRSAMRDALELEDPDDLAHNQPQLNEAPMRGDKQIKP